MSAPSDSQHRAFTKALLDDVTALEELIDTDLFEKGVRRIGAEQEMFLVDDAMRPAPLVLPILERAADPRLTTELALFNIEANASPRVFGGRCLSELERELSELVALVRTCARAHGGDVLLAGILPTLRKGDLTLDNMTPKPRYRLLNDAMVRLRGGDFNILIEGVDELQTTHDNVMFEASNTSFQIHFQVTPAEFARFYNLAQAVTAPVLAAAGNSPLFLGRRLWNETRIALFQLSTDTRSHAHLSRGLRPRVGFGEAWVEDSVLEIFKEQIARFRVVLPDVPDEDALADVRAGRAPSLTALRLHNGTVYSWNRACYGVHEGVPHLRIENRALPAGPTIVDEVANAALFFGLMAAGIEAHPDVRKKLRFEDAKNNFFAAAREGLRAQLTWTDGRTYGAGDLLLEHLLPMARQGLRSTGIDEADIGRYLDVVEERASTEQTGARWMLDSLAAMGSGATRDIRERTLARTIRDLQSEGQPVHEWPPCELSEDDLWRKSYRTVGQFMTTDLFTVRAEDLVDLAASVMDWKHIKHVPVEDDAGRLLGLVTHRALLRLVARGRGASDEPVVVRDIMLTNPRTVSPDTPTVEAMRLMRNDAMGCLPVVEDGRLVGIVTEADLIQISVSLLERYLTDED